MRIYTLGTSHGDSTASRFNSSTLYETKEGVLYLVDAGAPCEALIRRKGLDIRDVRACFITHMHDDHVGGLPGVLKQMVKYKAGNVTLFLPEEHAHEALEAWLGAMHFSAAGTVTYALTDDGLIYEDEYLSVTAIRTRHLRTRGRCEGEPCSFAYVLYFKKENVRVLHTGDLWVDFSDFPFSEDYYDFCLLEATHYPPEKARPVLEKCRFGRLIFIHVNDCWHVRVYSGWKAENGEKALLKEYEGLPYPVCVAHDGDEFLS